VHRGTVMRGRRHVGLADERGVALTEFVLITPILVLVLAGMLSFGLLFFYWLDANRLASETARWAVVDQNPYDTDPNPAVNAPSLQDHVLEDVPNGMKDRLSVCIETPDSGTGPVEIGDRVRVRIEMPHSFIPILNIGDVMIEASSTMRMERLANGLAPTAFTSDDDIVRAPNNPIQKCSS
jgi:hypothetical protein